ncbi:immunoglobulin domain-containing protein, partial [Candidatus Latescibacterota bacterium]
RIDYNQLTDVIPPEIGNLTNLNDLTLVDNQLTGLPDISSLEKLEYLFVENNQLTFEDIEPNIGVASTSFTYAPQDSVGEQQYITVDQGDSLTVSSLVGGENNQYQWKRNGNVITGATSGLYTIDSVEFTDAGLYTCEINNTVATDLTLSRRLISVTVTGHEPPLNEWTPTPLELTVQNQIVYPFDGSEVDFTVDVAGKPARAYLWINTRLADADKPVDLRNGYLGWHYVNKIDTTVYISPAYDFDIGSNVITWDGIGSENSSQAYMGTIEPSDVVAPGAYDYYVFAYDDENPRENVCNFLAISFYWHSQYTRIGEWYDDGTPRANPYLWGNVGMLYPDLHALKDDDGNIIGSDVENGWNSYGPPRFSAYKFPIGSDPDDMASLETTFMPGFSTAEGEELIPAPIVFDPIDESVFYALHDRTTQRNGAMFKWNWVAGGDALVADDWGGWDDLPIATTSERGADVYDVATTTDGNYIYLVSPGLEDGLQWDKFYQISFDGELVNVQMLDGFFTPEISDIGMYNAKVNKMFAALDYPWQAVMGGNESCLMMMVHTDRIAESDPDYVKWSNGNGDFFLDAGWDPEVTDPQELWQCNNDNFKTPNMGRRDEQWFDSNGIVVHHPDFQGLMSIVVYTQDGSGVTYAKFADDTVSMTDASGAKKGAGQRVDNGSIYDGMYVGFTLFEGGGYGANRQNINWIAQDSAHGVITSEQLPTFSLSIAVNPVGGGTTTPSVGVHHYYDEDPFEVNIIAIPAPGYEFVNWEGDVYDP